MVGGYCEDKGLLGNEDWDFWLGAAEAHFKAAHLAEPLYFYRQHKGSLMTKLALYDYQHREIMYNRHRDLFESYQMGSDFIAAGYLQSVKAYFYHGVYWRVPSLLIQTILLPGRINKPFWFLFFEFIPSFLEQIIKRGIHKFASQTRKMSELLAPKLYRLNFMREIHWDWRARDIDHLHGGLKNDYSILSEILERNGAERILDVSCGSGRLFPLYLSLGIREIVGQDIAPTAINMASLRYKDTSIQLVCSPVTDLNYPDSFFDLAICNRVLQHIPEENLHNVLDAICKMCRLVYVNEATAQDFTNQDKKSFIHDYTKLFNEIGYCVKEEGYVKSEASTSQKWVLYGRP
jgi:hypothetical protein